jgi:predicted methyltransferase
MIKKPLLYAKDLICKTLKAGDVAVDCTCGNGNDTVFLAQQVGSAGSVYAFDIQPQAIDATRQRLATLGLLEQVSLIGESHANLADHIEKGLDAAMFNLGYLPGGDHNIVTQPATTVTALAQTVKKLNQSGIITLVVYTGHHGGMEEYSAVLDYLRTLSQQEFSVLEYRLLNQANNPPLLLAVSRL